VWHHSAWRNLTVAPVVPITLWRPPVRNALDSIREISASREGNKLRIGSSSDGPFVITHVVAYGNTEQYKRVAALIPPIGIIDSYGASVNMSQLKWVDSHGNHANAPTTQRIEVLYVRPLTSPAK
jgi:hypothetical protein